MDAQIIRIRGRPGSGFHFGQRGIGQEESAPCPASDTLFAALVARLAARAPEAVDPFMEGFPRWMGGADDLPGDPPFLISSAFPYAGEVRFFPKPEERGAIGRDQASERRPDAKKLKRATYVSEDIFRSLLEGASLESWAERAVAIQGGALWLAPEELEKLPVALQKQQRYEPEKAAVWTVEQRPRVTLDRATSRSEIFHSGCTLYADGCGMWFAIAWRNLERPVAGRSVRDWLTVLLEDLEQTGLGGLRAAGMGACAITPDEIVPFPEVNGGLWLTLSRFHPRPEDVTAITNSRAAYRVVTVGGWVQVERGPDQRRIPVQMLAEGAVLGPAGPGPFGDVVDVRPRYENPAGDLPHPVWRYGLAFPVGFGKGGAP